MKEILKDGLNCVNNDGDVEFIDHPVWEQQEFPVFDHEIYNMPSGIEVQPKPRSDERPGAAINVNDRTVAVEGIMNYFNQANKTIGLTKSRGYNSFDIRYGREANEVMGNMTAKERHLYKGFMRAVDSLVNSDGLHSSGFSAHEIEAQRIGFMRDTYKQYGPGRAYAPERTKEVNRLKRAAKERMKTAKKRPQ